MQMVTAETRAALEATGATVNDLDQAIGASAMEKAQLGTGGKCTVHIAASGPHTSVNRVIQADGSH